MLMIACLLSFAAMCGCRTTSTPEDKAEQYRKAAEQGDAAAQYELGYCYFFGEGVEQDMAESVKWWRKAAEQGDAKAQSRLGHCYFFGEGVSKDNAESLKWFRKAADQGNGLAKDALKKLE